jgi:hypothetical protein
MIENTRQSAGRYPAAALLHRRSLFDAYQSKEGTKRKGLGGHPSSPFSVQIGVILSAAKDLNRSDPL